MLEVEIFARGKSEKDVDEAAQGTLDALLDLGFTIRKGTTVRGYFDKLGATGGGLSHVEQRWGATKS